MQTLKDLFTNGLESGFPVAVDKNGKLHCLLHEGYPPRFIGRGDNYEAIVAREGPPPAYRDTPEWSGLETFHSNQKRYRLLLQRLWAEEKEYPGLLVPAHRLCEELEPMVQGVESYILAKQGPFSRKERCRLGLACEAINSKLNELQLWLPND